jgi:hypothetical protein
MSAKRCPHPSATWCPLSVANDAAIGIGCDDGQLDAGGCAVDRGMDYSAELGRLLAHQEGARLVAECDWHRALQSRQEQRRRNMVLNGIH